VLEMRWLPFLFGIVIVALAISAVDVVDPKDGDVRFSFSGPFLQGTSGSINDHWTLGGAAVITDSFVRLTPAIKDRRGWIWSKSPVDFKSWDAEFEFKASGGRPPGADGFAFWYAQTPELTGNIYGNQDKWLGLGVIFDTYDNDRKNNNPYILAMLNDGTIPYDHNNDGLTNQLGGCVARYRSLSNSARARIIYKDNQLDVLINLGEGPFESCLHADNIHLPTGFYFGMSAATGALSDNHDIYNLVIRNLDAAPASTYPAGLRPDALLQPSAPAQPAPEQPNIATTTLPQFERGQRIGLASEKEALLDQGLETLKTNPAYIDRPIDPANPPAPLTDSQRLEQLGYLTRALHKDVIVLGEMLKNFYSIQRDVLAHVAIDKDVDALSAYMQQVQRTLSAAHDADAKGDIQRMRDFLNDRIVASNRDTATRLEDIVHKILTVHGSVEASTKEQDMIRHSIAMNQKQFAEQIKSSTKWGFWPWFIVFQFAFGVAFIWWKKNRDETQKKLP